MLIRGKTFIRLKKPTISVYRNFCNNKLRQNIYVMMKIVLFDERQFYTIIILWVFFQVVCTEKTRKMK